jgi:hypothetical protein
MKYIIWLIYFIPALLIEWLCWLTNPIACLFTTRKLGTDTVKRLDKNIVTLERDFLLPIFKLWNTHDNFVDEGWYGLYEIPFLKDKTQSDYDNSWLIRYWCRLWWLTRNTGYGWHYKLFSRPKEISGNVYTYGIENKGFWYELKSYPSSFQFEMQVPLGIRYLSINIGWKAHKLMPRLLYANRIIGFRKYD